MSALFYRGIGFLVWRGGTHYLRYRYGRSKRVGLGVGLGLGALALAAASAGGAARCAQRRSDPAH